MWKYVSNSLLCSFLIYAYKIIYNAYNESFISKCIKTLACWVENSLLSKTIQVYIAQTPKFSFSLTYKILAYCGVKLDTLVSSINSSYFKAYKGSLLYRLIGLIKRYKLIFYLILALALCTACVILPKIVAVGIMAVLATILILRNFERAVYLVGIYPILYFIAVSTDVGPLASIWDELLIVFCVGVWFYRWIIDRRDFSFSWSPVDFSLLIFFVVCISLFVAASFDRLGLDGLRAVIEYMLFFFIVIKLLRSEQGAKNLIRVMIFTGVYMSIIGIYQRIVRVETPAYWIDKAEVSSAPRVFSIVGSPNVLGCLLAMLIPLAISLIFSESGLLKKFLYTVASGIMGICLILTQSRSSWIALACAVVIYSILSKKFPLIFGLGVLAVLAYIFIPTVHNRISYMLDPAFIASSFKGGRFARWPKALEMFYSNLVYGVGFGQFGGSVATINKVRGAFYVDNYYIKAAVEMGLFGLIAFLVTLYNGFSWSLRASYKVEDNVSKGIIQSGVGAMVGILFTNLVLNNFDAPSVTTYFWTITAVCVYLGYIKKKPNNVLTEIIAKSSSKE